MTRRRRFVLGFAGVGFAVGIGLCLLAFFVTSHKITNLGALFFFLCPPSVGAVALDRAGGRRRNPGLVGDFLRKCRAVRNRWVNGVCCPSRSRGELERSVILSAAFCAKDLPRCFKLVCPILAFQRGARAKAAIEQVRFNHSGRFFAQKTGSE
jgi:hypothetical protein